MFVNHPNSVHQFGGKSDPAISWDYESRSKEGTQATAELQVIRVGQAEGREE
jgi:hypothetical protein